MSKATLLTSGLLLCVVAGWIVSCAPSQAPMTDTAPQAAQPPLGEVAITIPGTKPLTQPAVSFSHQTHADLSCEMCHHAVSNDNMTCCNPDCHATRRGGTEWHSYQQAYHAMAGPSCLNCHIEEKNFGENKDVPTECGECHVE